MRKFIKKINKILPALFIAVIIFGLFSFPPKTHAATGLGQGIFNLASPAANAYNLVFSNGLLQGIKHIAEHSVYPIMMQASYFTLTAAAVLLRVCGELLNVSIASTLNISSLVVAANGSTPSAIELVWKTIRDFSNIFLIFLLLYASIKMVLGLKGNSLSSLILSIVTAGLLINFSLFFTKLAVDASNVVALSFYKAIDAAGNPNAPDNLSDAVFTSKNGLSNSFMQGLRIQTLYSSTVKANPFTGDAFSNGVDLKIVIASIMGTVIMVIAGFSFLAAAIMFLIRIVYLVLLMAFSPLLFISMVFPETNKYASDWLKRLVNQCLFAPIYLIFMYVIIRIITSQAFGAFIYGPTTVPGSFVLDLFNATTITTVLQYALVIILINVGLATSVAVAGESGKWAMKATDWVKKTIFVAPLRTAGSLVGRQTLGRLGEKYDDQWSNTRAGNSVVGRFARSLTTEKMAKSKFGGSKSFLDSKKLSKEIKTKDREIMLKNELENAVKIGNSVEIKKALDKMSDNDIGKLHKDVLTKPLVAEHLSSKIYKQIEKSDRSEKDKEEIAGTRKKVIEDLVKSGKTLELSKILKTADKEDVGDIAEMGLKSEMEAMTNGAPPNANMVKTLLKKLQGDQLVYMDQNILGHPEIAVYFSESQLKQMTQLDQPLKAQIGSAIDNRPIDAPAYKYIQNNRAQWS